MRKKTVAKEKANMNSLGICRQHVACLSCMATGFRSQVCSMVGLLPAPRPFCLDSDIHLDLPKSCHSCLLSFRAGLLLQVGGFPECELSAQARCFFTLSGIIPRTTGLPSVASAGTFRPHLACPPLLIPESALLHWYPHSSPIRMERKF